MKAQTATVNTIAFEKGVEFMMNGVKYIVRHAEDSFIICDGYEKEVTYDPHMNIVKDKSGNALYEWKYKTSTLWTLASFEAQYKNTIIEPLESETKKAKK